MTQIIFFVLLMVPAHQDRYEKAAMKSLAEAERAFALMSVHEGVRKSFLAYFADDGIAFQPNPVVYKDAVKNLPSPADPMAFTLNWRPVFGDVSESGDLGYTTGPYSFVDNSGKQPARYGFYFSVWKRTSTTPWRVALDIGIGTPGPSEEPEAFRQAEPIRRESRERSLRHELEKNIAEYFSLAAMKGAVSAYENNLAAECRLHLEGHQPFIGREVITAFFAGKEIMRSGKILFVSASQSGDLGYAYGSYSNVRQGKTTENGYFGHVWKRNARGQWKLVAEILRPVPPETE